MKRLQYAFWKIIVAFVIFVTVVATADETKWIAINMLHDWFSSGGAEIEVGRRHLVADQQDGMRWPAMFKDQDSKAAKALWIGCTNYNDPIDGKFYAYKVVHIGPRVFNEESEFMPSVFKLYGRHDKSVVYVDGSPGGMLGTMDFVDMIDPSLTMDRLLYTEANTAIGITEKRRTIAFGQQFHNNYYINEYVFKNTGIIDKKGTTVRQTLEGVIFHFQYRYSVSKEACVYGLYILPQSAAWGHCEMNDTMWVSDPNSNEKYLSLFSWKGLHSKAGFNNIGAPDNRANGDGRLTAPHYIGALVLHADKSAKDKSNDKSQPSSTYYLGSDEPITSGNDQFNATKMAAEYAHMTKGHPPMSHADAVISSGQFADEWGSTPGGFSHCASFGPYTLEPGDSIRIVIAEAMDGLGREACVTVGAKWLKNEGPFVMPNGATAANRDDYKNSWVYTGRDSLYRTFQRVINAFRAGYKVPVPPPPPKMFEVSGGGDRIQLSWSNDAESWPNFAGYRVFRAIHTPDTIFTEIFACGAGTANPQIVNRFDDVTAVRGFDYYYYIVTFDNGSTNVGGLNPPGPLQSSPFYTKTVLPTNLKRKAGESLSQIRVVPNPFNLRARDLQYGYSAPDRINFLDIPPVCTIKIFTERGDLVNTIYHTNGSGDESWNSITSSQQVIVSGVYIAVFETPDGQKAIRKFVVIR